MKEHGKFQQREIAKKRLEAGYKRDKMEAMSSADFAPDEDEIKHTSPSKQLTDALNKDDDSGPSKSTSSLKKPQKNSFQ